MALFMETQMLHLNRNSGDGIIIGEGAEIRIWWLEGGSKVGLDCPAAQHVYRAELWLAKSLENSGGKITPLIQSVIDDMEYHCPRRLKQVDFKNGRLIKNERSRDDYEQPRGDYVDRPHDRGDNRRY